MKIFFYSLIAILPLFFLPFNLGSSSMDAFSKSYLFWFITPFLFMVYAFYRFRKGEYDFKKSFLDLPLAVFLLTCMISGIFGLDKFAAFFGSPVLMALPIFTIINLLLLFYFVINYVKDENGIFEIIKVLVVTYCGIVWALLFATLGQWFGFWTGDSLVFKIINSALGSFEDLSVYLAVMSVLVLAFVFARPEKFFKNISFIRLTWVLGLFFLMLINFFIAWWCVFAGAFIILGLGFSPLGKGVKKSRSKELILLAGLSVIFLTLNYTVSGQFSGLSHRQAINFQLDLPNSLHVIKESVKNNPWLGQGGETYPTAFSIYRGQEMNSLPWWNMRFNKGFSFAGDIIISSGIIGFSAYLFLLFSILFCSFKIYKKMSAAVAGEPNDEAEIFKGIFAVISVLIFLQIFYSQNIILLFFLFVFLSFLSISSEKHKIILFKKLQSRTVIIPENRWVYTYAGLAALLIGQLIFLGFGIKFLIAEADYQRAFYGQDILAKEDLYMKADRMHPGQSRYLVALAKLSAQKALLEAGKGGKENQGQTEILMNNAIGYAKSAIKAAPFSVVPYETLASIYRDFSEYSSASAPLAAATFAEARRLEPTNPVLLSELGKLYVRSGDSAKAEAVLREALNLKPGYGEAALAFAGLISSEGKNEEAAKALESISPEPGDVNSLYKIGMVYFNMRNYTKAEEKFREVIAFSPLNANALYSLGLSLEWQGKGAEALAYYKKVLNLNPDNSEIRNKILDFEK